MKGGEHTWAVSEPPAPGASSTAQTEMAAWGQICQPAPTEALALGVTLLGSAAGCLLGHQPLAFAGVRGRMGGKVDFVLAKRMETLRFSPIPVQLTFWWLVRKHSVRVYFGKTHLSPGMGNEVPGKKTVCPA